MPWRSVSDCYAKGFLTQYWLGLRATSNRPFARGHSGLGAVTAQPQRMKLDTFNSLETPGFVQKRTQKKRRQRQACLTNLTGTTGEKQDNTQGSTEVLVGADTEMADNNRSAPDLHYMLSEEGNVIQMELPALPSDCMTCRMPQVGCADS